MRIRGDQKGGGRTHKMYDREMYDPKGWNV